VHLLFFELGTFALYYICVILIYAIVGIVLFASIPEFSSF